MQIVVNYLVPGKASIPSDGEQVCFVVPSIHLGVVQPMLKCPDLDMIHAYT